MKYKIKVVKLVLNNLPYLYYLDQAFTNETLINLPDGKPKDWTVVVDDCYQAPYAYNGPYWIGYDDEESMRVKAKFINFLDIAGAMVWSIDTDDFKGGNTHAFPLLHVS